MKFSPRLLAGVALVGLIAAPVAAAGSGQLTIVVGEVVPLSPFA